MSYVASLIHHELIVPDTVPISRYIEGPVTLVAMPKHPSPNTGQLISPSLTEKIITPNGVVLCAGMDAISAWIQGNYLLYSSLDGASSSATPDSQVQFIRNNSKHGQTSLRLPLHLPQEPLLNFEYLVTRLAETQRAALKVGGDIGLTAMFALLYLLDDEIVDEKVGSGDTNSQFTLHLHPDRKLIVSEPNLPVDRAQGTGFLMASINSTSSKIRLTKRNYTVTYLSDYKTRTNVVFVFFGSDCVIPIPNEFMSGLTPIIPIQQAVAMIVKKILHEDGGVLKDDLTIGGFKLRLRI